MKVAGYEFSPGARFQAGEHPEAKEVGAHLDMLRQRLNGELQPADVVADAKNPNSPLHSFFEWSDTKAAHEHRLQQARGLIRSVVAIYVREEKPAVRTRAFVHIPQGETSHYRSADHAMSQRDTRDIVLKRALEELIGWQRRYKDLLEFAEFCDSIDQLQLKLAASKN